MVQGLTKSLSLVPEDQLLSAPQHILGSLCTAKLQAQSGADMITVVSVLVKEHDMFEEAFGLVMATDPCLKISLFFCITAHRDTAWDLGNWVTAHRHAAWNLGTLSHLVTSHQNKGSCNGRGA